MWCVVVVLCVVVVVMVVVSAVLVLVVVVVSVVCGGVAVVHTFVIGDCMATCPDTQPQINRTQYCMYPVLVPCSGVARCGPAWCGPAIVMVHGQAPTSASRPAFHAGRHSGHCGPRSTRHTRLHTRPCIFLPLPSASVTCDYSGALIRILARPTPYLLPRESTV